MGIQKLYHVPINMELPIEGKPVVRMVFACSENQTDLNEEVSRALSCTAALETGVAMLDIAGTLLARGPL